MPFPVHYAQEVDQLTYRIRIGAVDLQTEHGQCFGALPGNALLNQLRAVPFADYRQPHRLLIRRRTVDVNRPSTADIRKRQAKQLPEIINQKRRAAVKYIQAFSLTGPLYSRLFIAQPAVDIRQQDDELPSGTAFDDIGRPGNPQPGRLLIGMQHATPPAIRPKSVPSPARFQRWFPAR